MDIDAIIEKLENADCDDPFVCIFGMYGQNKKGYWGCFAKYPSGDPNEENQGCIAHKAAEIIRSLREHEEG